MSVNRGRGTPGLRSFPWSMVPGPFLEVPSSPVKSHVPCPVQQGGEKEGRGYPVVLSKVLPRRQRGGTPVLGVAPLARIRVPPLARIRVPPGQDRYPYAGARVLVTRLMVQLLRAHRRTFVLKVIFTATTC